MDEPQTTNNELKAGAYNGLQGYPQKIAFKMETPVAVLFPADYTQPKEMPNTEGDGVYYIFDCIDGNGDKASITTSAITLLNSLKSLEPLAGKNLVIVKKSVKGKTLYYVNRAGGFGAPVPENTEEPSEVDTTDAGLDEEGQM